MSEPQPTSYYEIALTPRQVTVAFVAVLGLLLGAFFAGVWIGGGTSASPPVAIEETMAGAGELGSPEEFERLDFFAEPGEPAPQSRQRSGPPADEPRRDDAMADAADLAPAPAPSRLEAREPTREAPQTDDAREIGGGAPRDAGSEAGSEEESTADGLAIVPDEVAPAPSAATQPPPAPAVGSDGHVIQVFSSQDETQAQEIVLRLAGAGLPAFLAPDEVGGRLRYRVRLGPYPNRGEAEVVADRVRRQFKLDTWITR